MAVRASAVVRRGRTTTAEEQVVSEIAITLVRRAAHVPLLEHMGNDGQQMYCVKYFNLDIIL